ncbi:SDR family oxidoreductase [Novosphingobium sp. 9U]|uniref:SDR family oxidoreductase n=1 Tax=Novosphingobium sp. 9U TaxID=2653158 RepID=UPI0012F0200E|nr:SDR family oxidoreductase [Novosphingobium sp. 9U]VWX46639.1 3-hydroxy-2-methylbutyryl-CoA dehydrogenase [Novosphingobium sp. 9U]
MKIDNTIAAIVTGGASGLGRASAKALADAGVKVAIFDISEEAGEAFASEIGGVFCNVNIMDEESVEAGFAKAREAHGQERIVVHCAVVAGGGKTVSFDKKTGAYKRTATEQIARSAEGIFTASYRVASIAALGMANADPLNEDGERGSIIFTSSAASQDGQVGQVAYGGGKGAVNAMVLPMARDLMDLGIRVNAILPGTFATPPMLRVKEHAPEVFEGLGKAVPFPKRLGNPEEFASLVLELARNTYMNGQLIRLDGAIRMPPK